MQSPQKWIWQQADWPRFQWQQGILGPLLARARLAQGKVLETTRLLDPKLTVEAVATILVEDGIATSAIEGEKLDPDAVRSSVARHLGLPTAGTPAVPRAVDGLIDVLLDATRQFQSPLTRERLFGWQASLFPTGRSFACRAAICGASLIGLCASSQVLAIPPTPTPGGGGGGPEPSPCLAGAKIDLSANPPKVTLGGKPSVVSWFVTLPSGCATVDIRLNNEAVAKSGSRSVAPLSATTFTLRLSQTHLGVHAETSRSVRVEVGYLPRVVIDQSTRDPVRVLLGALTESTNDEQTVELCNVDLDLTGLKSIVIGDGRSLIASPACARGPRRLGPRIFVRDQRGSDALFIIRGDNVRVSGFRLEGPTSGIAQGDAKERGISVWPFAGAAPIRNIEISNMEIFHWSGVGIQVGDNTDPAERGRLFNTNPGAVRVRLSFFHHNRHGAGDGYGVESTGGAFVTIQQNVFDENRHGIAGGSRTPGTRDFSGYIARDNLLLSGGGEHCSESWYWALTGWRFNCWQTHQIDMHGDQNEWYSGNNWECGIAGETMIIERNTILYTSGLAIKIRGNPIDKVVVDNNVFKHGKRSDAIAQNGGCGFGDNITKPIDVRPTNQFGVDPLAELGSCDFVGDGKQDQFMATGVTWWAKSPVTGQWRFLNTMKERLPELQLGDVDGDHICDISLRSPRPAPALKIYSKSGTAPWSGQAVFTRSRELRRFHQ
jgi:hypothetical protein